MGNFGGRIALVCLLAACAHNVGQDEHTGPDGKETGAKPVTLQDNVGKVKGIVTYPGGDRTDWKLIELPDKKVGTVQLELQWVPPRPGLQLAFDVFDAWNGEVVQSTQKAGKHRGKGRHQSATIDNAKGKYFVRVYAVDRGDAGTYKLSVDFKEIIPDKGPDWPNLPVQMPPRLPEIPDVVPEAVCDHFDPKNKACISECPFDAPAATWKGCTDICKVEDAANPKCWDKMACPVTPNINIKACTPSHWVPCVFNNPAAPTNLGNPNCNVQQPPITGRIIVANISGGDTIIQVGAGSSQGITKAWKVFLLNGDTDKPLIGGDVVVVRIDAKTFTGRVHLNPDVVNANPIVKFVAPPPAKTP